ncbi:MAG: ABC transporter substrate-binding protein [Desulfobacterales bacterium]|jgi:peptide/nickel transport system substrate-binding protein
MSELKKFEKMFTEGKITRRQFMAKVSALGLAAAVSPALLSKPAKAETPKKGGRFRMGLTGGHTTDNLDPATLSDEWNYNTNWMYRNCLVEIDYQGNPIPELAESWEASKDAATWTFKLRQGVEFHNGKTMDAEDVIYSINHHRGKDSKSNAKGVVDPIKDIKADSKNTLVFTLDGGNADFPYIMSDYHLTIVPAGTSGDDWIKGIGTGAYIQTKFEPGIVSAGKRNPNFFKEGRAHFDEIEMLVITDASARTNALKTGAIDLMTDVDKKVAHLLKRMPGIEVLQVAGTFHDTMPMMTDVAPYDNNDVRLALKYAVDREHMVKTILRGYGSVGNDHPIAPIQKYHAKDLPQRKYDPEKAKFHLKKAGLEGHTFKLFATDLGGFQDQAILYKEHAAKAGIDIDVVKKPADGYWEAVWLKEPWVMCYWNGRSTVDWMFSTAYSGDAKWNDAHFKHERFDNLLKEARAELDEKKRAEMYFETQKICRDEGGTIVHMFEDWVIAASEKCRYVNVAGNWNPDGAKAAERWWFA